MAMMDMTNGTGYGRIDVEDAVGVPIHVIAGFVLTGTASVSMFGFALSDTAFSVGGFAFSVAFIMGAASLAFAYATNKPSLGGLTDDKGMDQEYTVLTVASIALWVSLEFVPTVSDFVTSSDAVGAVVAVILAGGYYAISYLG